MLREHLFDCLFIEKGLNSLAQASLSDPHASVSQLLRLQTGETTPSFRMSFNSFSPGSESFQLLEYGATDYRAMVLS